MSASHTSTAHEQHKCGSRTTLARLASHASAEQARLFLDYSASLRETFHILGRLHADFFLETAAEVARVVVTHSVGQVGDADVFLFFHDAAGCLHADITDKRYVSLSCKRLQLAETGRFAGVHFFQEVRLIEVGIGQMAVHAVDGSL